jgi:diketogulonate reductase-like aldo/keto reductase
MQNQYNLLRRQDEPELMAMCGDMGVGLVPYSPNGKGRLARPVGEQSTRSATDHVVQSFDSEHDKPVINAVQQLAEARGVTMAQIALAWVLRNPLVSAPILGATKPHHLQQAVDALHLQLSDAEAAELTETSLAADRTSPPVACPRPPVNGRPSADRWARSVRSTVQLSRSVGCAAWDWVAARLARSLRRSSEVLPGSAV